MCDANVWDDNCDDDDDDDDDDNDDDREDNGEDEVVAARVMTSAQTRAALLERRRWRAIGESTQLGNVCVVPNPSDVHPDQRHRTHSPLYAWRSA
jgi:hypothetical protein